MALKPTTALPKDPLANISQKDYDTVQTAKFSEIYDYGGKELGYVSRYPEFLPSSNNENYFAEQQTGLEKFGNTLATFKNLSLNTFVNHFASYGRDINALTSGDYNELWNDALGEETARQILAQSNLNPLYETDAQQARRDNSTGAWGAIKQFVPFTGRAGNAWGTLAGQLGFTAGTIGAVGVETAALTGVTALTGGGAAPITATKTALNLKKGKDIATVWKLLKDSKNLFKVKQTGQELNMLGKALTSKPLELYRMGIAAQGESAIEANTSALEFKEEQIAKYIEQYGTEPTQEFINEVEENAIRVGNTTFNANMPILLASNAVTIGNLFNPRYLSVAKYAPESIVKDVVKKTGFLGTKSVIQTAFKASPKLQKALSLSNNAGNFLVKDKLMEGVEEVLQGVGSRAAQAQFDMFDSDYGRGMGAFILAAGDEIGRSAGSKEFWDEFVSGYLTGFGISIGKGGFNRITGVTKAQKEMVEKGINDLTSTYSNWTNLLKQNSLSAAKESAVAEGKTKEAKDLIKEAENAFYMELARYGVAEEKLDGIADAMKEMSEADQKAMLGDRTVDDVVRGLKSGYKSFETDLFTLRKNIQNPYKQGTEDYKTWDTALMIAASIHGNSQDMLKRGEALVREVKEKFPVDETMVSAMIDPTTLSDSLEELRKLESLQNESANLDNLTKEEKAVRQKELVKTQNKLKVLEKLENVFFENGELRDNDKINSSQAVSLILEGMYGKNVETAPKELQDYLKDIYDLEREGREYLNLYNILNNKENFNKFGKSFVDTYNKNSKRIFERLEKQPKTEQAPVTTETKTSEEVDESLDELEGIGEAVGFRKQIAEAVADVVKTADGKYKYEGKTYNDINALFDALKKKSKVTQEQLDKENKQGESLETLLKQELNGKTFAPETVDEQFRENTTEVNSKADEKDDSHTQVAKSAKPKSKEQKSSEKEFLFLKNSSGTTLTHYYDIVLSSIFSDSKNILDKLMNQAPKTFNQIAKAIKKFGLSTPTTLSAIYLADLEQMQEAIGDRTLKEFNETTEDMQIIYDGIRFFILTKGSQEDARRIIAEETNFVLNGANVTAAVENADGTHIASGFRKTLGLTENNDAAVHALKKGDNVNMYLSDKEYNEQAVEEAKKEIEKSPDKKTEILDKLIDKLLIEIRDTDGNLVGVLRAADFLFELNKTEIKDFRQRILDNNFNGIEPNLGTNIGSTKVKGISTTRNFNRNEDGSKVFTNVEEFSPVDRDGAYEKELFYVTENGEVINEKGEVLAKDTFEFDRGSLAPMGVYMRITGQNGKHSTVQVIRDNETQSGYTRKEFKDGQHLKDGLTDLKNDSPIVSKRLIIDMGAINEETTEKNDAQEVVDKAKEILEGQSTQTEIEAKEADIERRRQEELGFKESRFYIDDDGVTWTVEIQTLKDKKVVRVSGERNGESVADTPNTYSKELSNDKIYETENPDEYEYSAVEQVETKGKRTDKINAKYDVEIAALEQPTSNQEAITALEQKYGVKITISTETGKVSVEVVEGLSEEDAKQLQAELKEITEPLKKVTVVDNKGQETVLENPIVDGTQIGGISATDISDVKETEEKAETPVSEDKKLEWDDVQADTYEAIEWLVNNAVAGETYRLEDGTEVTVTLKKGKGVFAKIKQGNHTFYAYLSEESQIHPLIRNKETGNIEVEGLKDLGETSIQSVYREQSEVDEFVQEVYKTLSVYGVDPDVVFSKLLDAYQFSVINGTPITNYEILADVARLTEQEYFATQKALSPIFQKKFITFMANSETVWNSMAEEAWITFSEDLALGLDNLENANTEEQVEEETKRLNKLFNKSAIKIDLSNISFNKLKELATRLKQVVFDTDYKKAIKDTLNTLQEFGATIVAQTLFTIAKVDLNTLGKNPILFDELSPNLNADLTMISQEQDMYVKNEKDGLFVKVPKIKEKVSEDIWKVQKDLLSLTGITFPVTYLQAYKDLNENFTALKTRALKYKESLLIPNQDMTVELKEVEKVSKNNLLLSTVTETRAVYKNEGYVLIATNNDGKGVYLKEGKSLRAQDYRAMLRELGMVKNTPKKIIRVANLYANLKKIKDERNKITCS